MNTSATDAETSTPRTRRRPSIGAVGAAVIVVSVVIGIGLPVAAELRRNDAVADLARIPAGCVAQIDVRRPGVYLVYVETRGRLDALAGSCSPQARSYDFVVPPRVRVGVTTSSGDRVPLRRTSGPNYDTGDFTGSAVRRVDLDSGGDHLVTVASPEGDAVVAVGIDVSSVGRDLRTAGFAVGGLGVLLGLGLVIRGVASPSRFVRTR
jgi:hypothetical protein